MSFTRLSNILIFRLACMYVSMHVCVHVYIYAESIYVCIHTCMYICMFPCMSPCMYVGTNLSYMYVSMHISMHVCMNRPLFFIKLSSSKPSLQIRVIKTYRLYSRDYIPLPATEMKGQMTNVFC